MTALVLCLVWNSIGQQGNYLDIVLQIEAYKVRIHSALDDGNSGLRNGGLSFHITIHVHRVISVDASVMQYEEHRRFKLHTSSITTMDRLPLHNLIRSGVLHKLISLINLIYVSLGSIED
jgi:hypothetical protein